jgi:hypothetical protein
MTPPQANLKMVSTHHFDLGNLEIRGDFGLLQFSFTSETMRYLVWDER